MNSIRHLLLTLALISPFALAGDGEILFINSFEGTGNVPQFLPVEPQAGVVDQGLQIDIDTSEPANQNGILFSLDSAPVGLTIRSDTGVIGWTPGITQVGTASVTVRVADLEGLANTLTFPIEVVDPNAAPLLLPIADQGLAVGDSLNLVVEPQDPDPSDPATFSLDAAPAGMTLDPVTGQLDWTPALSDIGSTSVTVRATDAGGRFSQQSFTVNVVSSNTPPDLVPIDDRGAAPGVLVRIQAEANDPDIGDVLRWRLLQRPPGMSIDAESGELRWTPTTLQLGPHTVEVQVRDVLGATDEAEFEVFVDRNRPPVAIGDPDYRVERGDTLVVAAPGVLGNDEDPNSDPLTTQLVTPPTQGSLNFNADGSFDYTPDNPAGTIDFQVKWEHVDGQGGNEYMPLIGNLDDDPQSEIVIFETSGADRELIALDGITGQIEWQRVFTGDDLTTETTGAIADIDLDGRPEILYIGAEPASPGLTRSDRLLYAFEHHGGVKWVSEPLPETYYDEEGALRADGDGTFEQSSITVADLDQDGIPEILVAMNGGFTSLDGPRYQVFNAEGRKIDYGEAAGGAIVSGYPRVEVVDLDLDGDPEIVVGSAAWSHDGDLLWSNTDVVNGRPSDAPIIVNIDDDPYPELIRNKGDTNDPFEGDLVAWDHNGVEQWRVEGDYGPFNASPMIAADLDADGRAEILIPKGDGENRLDVLNGIDGSLKWSNAVADTGRSSTTVFDLDRDGFNEVVFIDDDAMVHVWDGRDGASKLPPFELQPGVSGTIPNDNSISLFADIDADGRAEFITPMPFAFGTRAALRVWESSLDDWGPMRSIWNQRSYVVTNVNDDLTIPANPAPHWLEPGLNLALVNARLPESRDEETDRFEYTASDGEFISNVAEVEITVLPPNATPRILSTPRLLASPGFEYIYPLLAVDGDPGETLSLSIAEGPIGMVIDSQDRVAWTPGPGDLGAHVVVVSATDSQGARTSQNFVIDVVAPVTVPDLSGATEAQAIADLQEATLVANPVRDTFSDTVAVGDVALQSPAAGTSVAAGSNVRIEISRGPVPVRVPRLTGLDEDDALVALADVGLGIATIERINDPNIPRSTVASQDPAPGFPVPPGSDVSVVISGGPRAAIAIDPPMITAGGTATISVEVRDVDGTPLEPQPSVALSLQSEIDELFGTPPVLNGSTIETALDTQGKFRVEASFTTRGSEVIAAEAAVLPSISDGPGGSVYSEFPAQIELLGELIESLTEAIEINDGPEIEALDQALADLEAGIDVRRLRTMTPFAPEGGLLPTPSQAQNEGLMPASDDAGFASATLDVLVLLEEIDSLVREGNVADLTLNLLNQDLAAAASANDALDPSAVGVLEALPELTAILGTYAPRVVVADIQAIRAALRNQGILNADGQAQAGRFTLPGILTASGIRRRIITNFYLPYLGQAAFMMGTVIAADALQTYSNAGQLIGIITGASQSIHVFNVEPSAIEGFGFDAQLTPNNSVIMIGPKLIADAQDAIAGLPAAEDFKDLNTVFDAVQSVIDSASAADKAWDDANSIPGATVRGCILNTAPGCSQLIYPTGFATVYESDQTLNLPSSVLIITRNLEVGGGTAVFLANFVPSQPED